MKLTTRRFGLTANILPLVVGIMLAVSVIVYLMHDSVIGLWVTAILSYLFTGIALWKGKRKTENE